MPHRGAAVPRPWPHQPHASLCRLLTVVLTEEWLGLLGAPAALLPECVRLATIPNVIPSEHGRAADFSGFIEAVHTKMEAPVERLLRGVAAAPAAVVLAVGGADGPEDGRGGLLVLPQLGHPLRRLLPFGEPRGRTPHHHGSRRR
ncbi:hypothetical protein SEVIR_5G357700v4 [Setaria viridis]|uniref:Uncharacterized protein n=1 Tax=Setaria viridis TaxID=4556 RepID=A0A4U6ULM6_SETVI|nr:hypothetical protein SEVIR_5G357700v2 [Setaria viridis]